MKVHFPLARLSRDDKLIVIALVLFTLLFRLGTIMMMNTGVDERDYWQSAKALARGLPYPELSHRTTRFALILPVALAQLVFGSHPNVYYVLPVLNSMLQAALAYAIGLRLRGRMTGFLAALALGLFPYMIRAGSQVRPEVFSITYILLATMYFLDYLDRERDDIRPLVVASLWLFVSYESKITNLFFVPGLMLAILVFKRKPGHALIMGGILFGLFLAETGLYAIFTKYKFGELEIILQKHFHPDSFTVPNVLALLRRYSPRYLQPYWSLPFAAFAAASVLYLARGKDKRIGGLILGALSFFFFLTISVKDLHPVTPAEPFINRYFCAVLGPVFLVLAFAAEGAAARLLRGRRLLSFLGSARACLGALAIGAVAFLVIFSLPGLPRGIRAYAISPLHLGSHPFALNEGYRRSINEAYADGTPIVASAGLAGENAILTCSAFFIDVPLYRGGRPPEITTFARNGLSFNCLSATGEPGDARIFLAARRSPFRIEPIGPEGLPKLVDSGAIEINE